MRPLAMTGCWRVVIGTLISVLCGVVSSSSPSSVARDQCQGSSGAGCEPDLVITSSGSYTLVKRSTDRDQILKLFVMPGADFSFLNITLGFAKLSKMPDGAKTLPDHLWEGVKNWLFEGPLEKVRGKINSLLATVSRKLGDLTGASHSQVLSASTLGLSDACRWYNLTVQAIRSEQKITNKWALRVLVDGAVFIYPTSYWWSLNWVLWMEVSSMGSSKWVTTRDTVCPSHPWVAVAAAVVVGVVLVISVAVTTYCFYKRKCCGETEKLCNVEVGFV
ncbi:uncharacterized protein [Cherax quadricarinatus]|uniref:uncharacterized protein n=1 Tax=Cherax quadricarinatus TaxID=27406 RepID=UPI00387E3758